MLTAFNLNAQCPDDTLPVSPASAAICDGETVDITVSTSEATVTYRLKDGLGNVISSDYAGNGAALVLTSDPLTSSTTIEVEAELGVCTLSLLTTVPVTVTTVSAPTASDPTPICEGEPTPSLTATGTGIQWYSDAGLSNLIGVGSPFIPSATYVDNTTAGTYSVWATSTSAGCESSATQVDVLVEPALVVDAGSDTEVCIGSGVSIGGTPTATGGDGSYTYSWTPTTGLDDASLANPTASPTITTNYTVTVTDGNGCAVSDAVLVTVNSLPIANAGADLTICETESIQIGGSPSATGGSGVYTYSWTPTTGLDDATLANPLATPAATTVYTLTVTDNNGCVSVADNMTVTVNAIPSAPTASNPTPICEGEPTPALTATGAGTIRWYSDAGLTNQIGTGSPFVPSVTYVDNTSAGTYSVYVTDTQNSCESVPTQVDITVNAPPVADAGTGGIACGDFRTFTLSAVLSNPSSTGVWTYTGPDFVFIVDETDPNSDVFADSYGTYIFTWEETLNGCSDTDDVIVTFVEQPVADAGSDADACGTIYGLNAVPSILGSIGTWSGTGPGNISFNNINSPTATLTVDSYGTYDITWTETNGSCSDAETIQIQFFEPTTADAGSDQEVCDLVAGLSANPSTPYTSRTWTFISGPGTPLISDSTDPNSSVTVDQYGIYVFEWTEVNGPCTSVDQVVVTFREQPTADAGTGGDVCNNSYLLAANPSVGTGVWTYTGPGTATFNNASSPNATVTVDTYGFYDFTWTETNGTCSDASTITLNFIEEPNSFAGPDQEICGLDVTMAAVPSTGNGLWTMVSGPGTPSYGDPTSNGTTISVSDYGTYIFEWTEDNAGCIDTDQVTIRFYEAPTIVSVDNDGTLYCEPASILITGTIGGGATQANWSIVSGGTGTLSASSITGNVVSATYFPTTDEFGTVTFQLTTNDPDGTGPCVADSQLLNLIITEAPEVNAGLDVEVCEDQGYVDLSGTIGGSGTVAQWSGGLGSFDDASNPVTRYNFDLSEIGSTIILTLTVFDPDGSGPCIAVSDNVAVTINPLPIVNFFNLPAVTDEGKPPIDIVGNNAGGTFTITPGSGLSNPRIENGQDVVTFDPGAAVVSAANFITYTYTDLNGCTNSITKSVFVNEVTAIDFELQDSEPISIDEEQICQNVGLVRLIGTPSAQSGQPGTEFTSAIPGLVSLGADSEWYFDTNIVTPGLYTVQYTYVNSVGATSVRIKDVRVVGTPVPAFEQLTFCESGEIQFNDLSTIDDTPYATTIVGWEWDFGDGTSVSTLQNPTHQYASAGFYDITLTVTSDLGCSSTIVQNIRVGAVPEVAFDWVGSCGNDPIAFENVTATNSLVVPNTITWDFGDGDVLTLTAGATIPPGTHGGRTFGTIDMPMHLYQTSGYYDVTLTVLTDSDCQNSSVQTVRASNLIEITTTTDTLYYEDFSAGGADWGIPPNEDPAANSWRWSSTGGGLGSGVWYTGANGGLSYPNENSTIEGPCFNLLGLDRPMIAMDIYFNTEESIDGAVMQYSTDGGSSWVNLGRVGEGIAWYNQSGIVSRPGDDPGNFNSGSQGWSGAADTLHTVRFSLDEIPVAERSFVRFRVAFGARSLDNTSDSYFAIDNIFIGNKQRRALLENFADYNRVASTTANTNIEQIRQVQLSTQGYSDFTLLEYHINDSGTDSLYLSNTSDANARSLYYGVNQAPSVFLDGLKFQTPPDPGKPADLIRLDRQSLLDPAFSIQIDTLVSPNDVIRVAVTVTALQDVSASLSLHVAVVETKNEPSAVLNQIMRKLIFGGGGQTLPIAWTTGQTQVYTGEWEIDIPIPNNDKMDIIAFVQDNGSREIYQSEIVEAPLKDTGSNLVTGLEDDIETIAGSVDVYPNPANGYFRIRLPQDLTGTYDYSLIDLRGITIRSGKIDRTYDTFTISTDSITNGMYYLIISANGEPLMQRKIAIINR